MAYRCATMTLHLRGGLRGETGSSSIESPHPLESNQNLSVFSRARRPATPEWDVAPCVRCWRTRGAVVDACQAPFIIIALRLSESSLPPCAARTSGLDAAADSAG